MVTRFEIVLLCFVVNKLSQCLPIPPPLPSLMPWPRVVITMPKYPTISLKNDRDPKINNDNNKNGVEKFVNNDTIKPEEEHFKNVVKYKDNDQALQINNKSMIKITSNNKLSKDEYTVNENKTKSLEKKENIVDCVVGKKDNITMTLYPDESSEDINMVQNISNEETGEETRAEEQGVNKNEFTSNKKQEVVIDDILDSKESITPPCPEISIEGNMVTNISKEQLEADTNKEYVLHQNETTSTEKQEEIVGDIIGRGGSTITQPYTELSIEEINGNVKNSKEHIKEVSKTLPVNNIGLLNIQPIILGNEPMRSPFKKIEYINNQVNESEIFSILFPMDSEQTHKIKEKIEVKYKQRSVSVPIAKKEDLQNMIVDLEGNENDPKNDRKIDKYEQRNEGNIKKSKTVKSSKKIEKVAKRKKENKQNIPEVTFSSFIPIFKPKWRNSRRFGILNKDSKNYDNSFNKEINQDIPNDFNMDAIKNRNTEPLEIIKPNPASNLVPVTGNLPKPLPIEVPQKNVEYLNGKNTLNGKKLVLFKPETVSLFNVYENFLEKLTMTVLVPFHVSELTRSKDLT